MARVLMVVISVAITIYAVADISRTPKDELPARIPKPLWLLLAILLTPVGGLAWIIVSRVTQAEARGGEINRGMWYSDESAIKTTRFRRPHHNPYYSPAPDDDPDFLWSLEKELRTLRSEEEIREAERRMDEAIAALENEKNLGDDSGNNDSIHEGDADDSEESNASDQVGSPDGSDQPGESDRSDQLGGSDVADETNEANGADWTGPNSGESEEDNEKE